MGARTGMPMVSIVTFATSMLLSLANSGHSPKVMPAGGAPSFLFSSCLGSVMPAPARHDRERRLVVDHENRSHRWRRMLIAIFDEGIDIGEAHVIGARCNASDRLEHGRRLVEHHVEALVPEVALVLGEEKSRSQSLEASVERELDAGLGRGRPCGHQCDRRREDMGGPNDPPEVEEAHGCSLYVGPRATRRAPRLRQPDKEHERAKRKARSRFEPALHKFQTPPQPFCARMRVILQPDGMNGC